MTFRARYLEGPKTGRVLKTLFFSWVPKKKTKSAVVSHPFFWFIQVGADAGCLFNVSCLYGRAPSLLANIYIYMSCVNIDISIVHRSLTSLANAYPRHV